MSYKLGFILSMGFVAMFFLFGVDMLNIQFLYTDLDQTAISIGYMIAKQGNLTSLPSLEKQYNVKITCLSNCTPMFGDVVKFEVSQDFKPIVISKDNLSVSICRTTVIGFYE